MADKGGRQEGRRDAGVILLVVGGSLVVIGAVVFYQAATGDGSGGATGIIMCTIGVLIAGLGGHLRQS
jgi:hypothetical protein